METKNELYVNRNKGSNPELQWYNYKMYHNMFNHVMRKTERNIIGIYVQLKLLMWSRYTRIKRKMSMHFQTNSQIQYYQIT